MKRYFLSINSDGDFAITNDDDVETVVNSVDEYNAFFAAEMAAMDNQEDFTVQASSSIDFPTEFTSKPNVLAICQALDS